MARTARSATARPAARAGAGPEPGSGAARDDSGPGRARWSAGGGATVRTRTRWAVRDEVPGQRARSRHASPMRQRGETKPGGPGRREDHRPGPPRRSVANVPRAPDRGRPRGPHPTVPLAAADAAPRAHRPARRPCPPPSGRGWQGCGPLGARSGRPARNCCSLPASIRARRTVTRLARAGRRSRSETSLRGPGEGVAARRARPPSPRSAAGPAVLPPVGSAPPGRTVLLVAIAAPPSGTAVPEGAASTRSCRGRFGAGPVSARRAGGRLRRPPRQCRGPRGPGAGPCREPGPQRPPRPGRGSRPSRRRRTRTA